MNKDGVSAFDNVCMCSHYKGDTLKDLFSTASHHFHLSGKTPATGQAHGANKENLSPMAASSRCGYPDSAPSRRNFSINSVASTYSEFAVIHLF